MFYREVVFRGEGNFPFWKVNICQGGSPSIKCAWASWVLGCALGVTLCWENQVLKFNTKCTTGFMGMCVCVHNFKRDGVPLCLSTHIGLMMVAARDRQFYCIRYTVKSFFSLFLYKINIWTTSPCTGLRDGGDHVTTTTTRAVRSGELFGEHMRLISMPFFASSGGSSSSSVGFWKTFSGAARWRKTYSARVKQGDRVWERVWARTSDPDGWKADENDEENYTFYSASLSAGPEQSSSGWPRRVRRRFFFFCSSVVQSAREEDDVQ